jgi:type IV secretory pathway VirB2 component (pilin)
MRISLSTHALIALVMALALIVATPMVFAEEANSTATAEPLATLTSVEGATADTTTVTEVSTKPAMTKEQRMQAWIEAYQARMTGRVTQVEQKQMQYGSKLEELRAKAEARIAAMRAGKGAVPTTPVKSMTAEQAACIAPLVDDREEAVAEAFGDYSTAITDAMSDRREALADAWALTDSTARATAVKAAWDAYKSASKSTHEAMRTARDAAHQTFRTGAKACGTNVPAEEVVAPAATDALTI